MLAPSIAVAPRRVKSKELRRRASNRTSARILRFSCPPSESCRLNWCAIWTPQLRNGRDHPENSAAPGRLAGPCHRHSTSLVRLTTWCSESPSNLQSSPFFRIPHADRTSDNCDNGGRCWPFTAGLDEISTRSGFWSRLRATSSSFSRRARPSGVMAHPRVSRVISLSPKRCTGPASALRARIRVDHSLVESMAKSLFRAPKLAWPSGYDESTLSMAMLIVMICRQSSA
jgi:hypothetical protein